MYLAVAVGSSSRHARVHSRLKYTKIAHTFRRRRRQKPEQGNPSVWVSPQPPLTHTQRTTPPARQHQVKSLIVFSFFFLAPPGYAIYLCRMTCSCSRKNVVFIKFSFLLMTSKITKPFPMIFYCDREIRIFPILTNLSVPFPFPFLRFAHLLQFISFNLLFFLLYCCWLVVFSPSLRRGERQSTTVRRGRGGDEANPKPKRDMMADKVERSTYSYSSFINLFQMQISSQRFVKCFRVRRSIGLPRLRPRLTSISIVSTFFFHIRFFFFLLRLSLLYLWLGISGYCCRRFSLNANVRFFDISRMIGTHRTVAKMSRSSWLVVVYPRRNDFERKHVELTGFFFYILLLLWFIFFFFFLKNWKSNQFRIWILYWVKEYLWKT